MTSIGGGFFGLRKREYACNKKPAKRRVKRRAESREKFPQALQECSLFSEIFCAVVLSAWSATGKQLIQASRRDRDSYFSASSPLLSQELDLLSAVATKLNVCYHFPDLVR